MTEFDEDGEEPKVGPDFTPTDHRINEDEEAAIHVYLEARRQGYGPITAARLVNSTPGDIEIFARLNESFQRAIQEAEAESLERVEVAVKDKAQRGDMTAAKLVLESHIPDKWMKPEREMLLRLGEPMKIDVRELHQRLKAIDAGGSGDIIDVDEVTE